MTDKTFDGERRVAGATKFYLKTYLMPGRVDQDGKPTGDSGGERVRAAWHSSSYQTKIQKEGKETASVGRISLTLREDPVDQDGNHFIRITLDDSQTGPTPWDGKPGYVISGGSRSTVLTVELAKQIVSDLNELIEVAENASK